MLCVYNIDRVECEGKNEDAKIDDWCANGCGPPVDSLC